MPIVVSNEGWVKVPPKRATRPAKPVNPVDVLRGPLAYITGRPEFKEPVKKQSIKQLMIEAARTPAPLPPSIPIIIDDTPRLLRSSRTRSRPATEVVSVKSNRHKASTEIFEEADEEIVRPDLQDTQSRRSASPAASRHSKAAPSTRSRRYVSASQPAYDEDGSDHRHHRSRRHVSSSAYSEDRVNDHQDRHRSSRSERSYREPSYRDRSRDRERYYPHPIPYSSHYPHHYAPQPPSVQPIVIYSSPAPSVGCGGHHTCHGGHAATQCHAPVHQQLGLTAPTAPAIAALPEPKSAPSEISSVSTGSTRSKAMSYKWYTATQPLQL